MSALRRFLPVVILLAHRQVLGAKQTPNYNIPNPKSDWLLLTEAAIQST